MAAVRNVGLKPSIQYPGVSNSMKSTKNLLQLFNEGLNMKLKQETLVSVAGQPLQLHAELRFSRTACHWMLCRNPPEKTKPREQPC